MKRFGVRTVGLGLALAAGSVLAADDWRPASGPALSPPTVPIWVSANPAPPAPARELPPPELFVPAVGPGAVTPAGGAPLEPVGPRAATGGGDPFGSLPAIPVAGASPELHASPVAELPPIPLLPEPAKPQPAEPQPLPQPKPVESPAPQPVMPQPQPVELPPGPPAMSQPQPPATSLPQPRPVHPSPQQPHPGTELPPAPPELMYPVGAIGGKHAAFGSAPIRISRDFPPLGDLVHHGHTRDLAISDEADGPFNRFFVRGEYLLWWLPGYGTPVLGTTNANLGVNGFLGEPGTTAIFGPGPVVESLRSGFRLRAGLWLNPEQSCGLDGSFFFLGRRSDSVALGSEQFPLITRPVFVPNAVPGTDQPLGEAGESVAVPGILRGSLAVQGTSLLWGADVNLRKCLVKDCDEGGERRAEWFAGYRHLNLRESLSITENITVTGPGGDRIFILDPIGTRVFVQDRFRTRNAFHGGQIGVNYSRRLGSWEWDARASVALGGTHQVLEIDGIQVRTLPGGVPPMTFAGGLLAAGPNLGRFTRDRFSVVPEFGLNVGYWVTPSLRVYAGYNLLVWTNVIRPGDQIDRVVDLTFVPNSLPDAPFSGQNRPRPTFKQSDVTIQGVQFGIEWRW